jgi:uncharacterized protein
MEIWLAFLAGIAGSAHCVGMCGGIVAAFSGGNGAAPRTLAFNLGRVCTYSLLGFSAGLLGEMLDLLLLRSVSTAVFCIASLFVAASGLFLLLKGDFPPAPAKAAEAVQRLFPERFRVPTAAAGFFPLGMLFGFLPCGLVYAPLAAAAGTGDPLRGAAVMAALGAGTVPALFIAGSLSGAASPVGAKWPFRILGAVLVAMGAIPLWRIFTSL